MLLKGRAGRQNNFRMVKTESRRQQAEGGGRRAEGRGQQAEGRRPRAEGSSVFSLDLSNVW